MRVLTWIAGLLALLAVAFGISWLFAMPNAQERGVWQHEANGSLITLDRLQARLYQQTSHSCVETGVFPAHMALVTALEGAWIRVDGDTLALHIDGNLNPAQFHRIDALPAACTQPPNTDAASVFEAMWTFMDEHYAFFDLHGVDWDARRALAPTAGASDEELFSAMFSALEGLDDGHVQLGAGPFGFHSPSVPPDWYDLTGLDRDGLTQIGRDAIGIPLTPIENTGLEYGLREDGIGYILIRGMSTDPGFGQLGTDLAHDAFAEVATALSEASALIIDVRYNPGGDDGTAMAYASFFTDTALPVLTKRTRDGDGWTQSLTSSVPANTGEVTLLHPTILLTSELTGSGAEIFTIAMREMPQVTVLGSATSGGLSDILGTTLPNGWLFGLSNQEYRTMNGDLYEGTGIPPDIWLETDGEALATGRDLVLEDALQRLSP